MTERVKVALIGAIAPTLAAVAIIWTAQINHTSSGKKLDTIHEQTNSSFTEAKMEIATLRHQLIAAGIIPAETPAPDVGGVPSR